VDTGSFGDMDSWRQVRHMPTVSVPYGNMPIWMERKACLSGVAHERGRYRSIPIHPDDTVREPIEVNSKQPVCWMGFSRSPGIGTGSSSTPAHGRAGGHE